ncbi:MAG: TonB family protein [Bacteroidales bacterium]|nr:TonB family protein [Bacteroidales bacterium]
MQENITVPEKYMNMDTKATYRVMVKFVVEADGSVTEVETVRPEPSKQDLNDEAVRVVKGMPKWKPGTMDGKPVRVRYMLPVTYKLGK